MREVAEETGLTQSDLELQSGWTAVVAGPRIALMKAMQAKENAEQLRQRILHHLSQQSSPELIDVRIVRNSADFDPEMPEFMTAFLSRALAD